MEGKKSASLLQRLTERMRQDRKLSLIVYGGLILVGLVLLLSAFLPLGDFDTYKSGNSGGSALTKSELETEARLERILSSIRGAGKVEVMVLYGTGEQLVPAVNQQSEYSSESAEDASGRKSEVDKSVEYSKPVLSSGSGGDSVVLTRRQPEIRGVIVSAEGAADIAVRVDLALAVQTVLGIKAELVEVFIMNSGSEERGR